MDFSKRIFIEQLNDARKLNQLHTVIGWIKRVRKLGNLCFINLSDKTGMIQVVTDQSFANFEAFENLNRESVIGVTGVLQKRSSPNIGVFLGEYELKLSEFNVISVAKTPPLIIENETDALEEVRLKYRYLDLRRPIMQQRLALRFKFLQAVRNYLQANNFTEIETPTLTKPTPEGARDYVVPTRLGKNRFYALPQSPQIYKQLLMISGMERYFQIARCYRDEDSRKDRQPEHTQIDLEMSFCSAKMIQSMIEGMFINVFEKSLKIPLSYPFPRMTYQDAMDKYGTDKPDIRFEMLLSDAKDLFINGSFNVFKNLLQNGGFVKSIHLEDQVITSKQVNDLEKIARDNHASGLAWITYENQKITGGSIAKFIDFVQLKKLYKLKSSGSFFFVGSDSLKIVQTSLGAVRSQLNEMFVLSDPNNFAFVWITDWPLYEWNDQTQTYESAHNLFTSPSQSTIATYQSDKANALADSYDLVLNGFELGSGAIRISDPKLQKEVMTSLGLSEQQIKEKFGFLLEAYQYGAPVHGGMGLGVDRIMMLISKAPNIREVIAFPKNTHGYDLMMQTPSEVVDDDFLKELFIKIDN
ncbi:aspartate--tRNA ligase [[Mycoplasma] testudinis]|uniref:aspartate--tRNA ligase n=1 Tax=[Mycoplasma] testudinis TaxID=33924 RepID=UPI000AE8928D|nr:aspartate--tRNA ligase [[Mycoplasma] testudinis]